MFVNGRLEQHSTRVPGEGHSNGWKEGTCIEVRQENRRLSRTLTIAAALLGCFLTPLRAQVPQENRKIPVAPTKPVPTHEMTAADIEAFLDGFVPLQLGNHDIAGAVILIVKDGSVVFQKGYGYADVAKKTPVSPDGTLFRIGSVSKLFTWTAMMQMVEQGKVNLDEDVNRYLDFKIPATYAKPITVRNLMTHTTGFNEAIKGLIVQKPTSLPTLNEYLKQELPTRIFPAGVVPEYSNYGATVAGYIVQRVSGQPFDDYIEQHILQPVNMNRATFRQPLPPALKPLMSSGYSVASQPAKPYEFVVPWPAGSVAASGVDMSHFMLAHLQNGKYGNSQILRPETVQLMHSRQFAYDPRLNGMCLGFYEETRNGHRIIGHAGDTVYFHTDLHLMQDANLGFFVSYNSGGKGPTSPRGDLWEAFLNRYFPYTPPAGESMAHAEQGAKEVAGNYLSSRRSQGTVLSFLQLASQVKVSANQDGTIGVSSARSLSGYPTHFREIGPLLFREVGGQHEFAFDRDSSGRLVMSTDFPFFVFQRTPLSKSTTLNLTILIYCLVVFLLILLFWPIAAVVRRHYGRTLEMASGNRRLRLLVHFACIIIIVFAAGWIWFLSSLSGGGLPTADLDPRIRLFQVLGWLGIISAVIIVYAAYRFLREPVSRWFKIYNIAAALACAGLVWFIFNWHLLSPSLKY